MSRGSSRAKFLAASAGFGLAATRVSAAEAYTMRLSVPTTATSVFGQAATHFAQAVGRRSNGQISVEVYPSGQLFKEAEAIDALVSGVLDFAVSSTSFMVGLFPSFLIFDMPFLFKNVDQAYRLVDGPIGNELFGQLESHGIVGIGWGTGGLKQMETTTKVITAPEDLKGLRIRTNGGQIYPAAYQAMGAIPVQIDFNEVLTALSQHTLDGVDVIIDGFTTSKFYTACKHVAMTNHGYSANPIIASKRKLDALPAPLQKVVHDEGKSVVSFWRTLLSNQTNDDVKVLKDNGVAFSQVQYAAFRKAVEPVYTVWRPRLPNNLLDRVEKSLG